MTRLGTPRARAAALRQGGFRLAAALVLPLGLASGAGACPLCYEAARQMMTEGVQLDATDRAVLASRAAGDGALKIVAVVKGSDRVGGAISDPVDEANGTLAGPPALLIRDPTASRWTSLGAIPLADADWLRRLAATRDIPGDRPKRTWPLTTATADTLSDQGWRQRVALVAPRLEDPDPLASRLASRELARAPYAALDAARSRADPLEVEAWIDDPRLAARRATYLTLLGVIGGPDDAARLDRRLDAALASHDAPDLAALIASDLRLGGPSRIDILESRIFRDRSRTMPEVEAALLALSVLGESDPALRPDVAAAYRVFIEARPPMAGFVAPQLAAWGYWGAASNYASLLKSRPDLDPASQFAIVNYLKRAAAAGVAVK